MQLTRATALWVAAALLAWAPPIGARVESNTRLTIFEESSSAGKPIHVLHPQTDVSAGVGKTMSIGAGYEVDVVSGATPTIFAPRSGPDAITAATQFSDERHVVHGALGVNTPLIGLSAAYFYGTEHDYRSHTLSASARGDFLERNFTLALAYTRNIDSVCDQNNANAQGPLDLQPLGSSAHCFQSGRTDVATRSLNVHTFEPSLVWTATPRLLLQLGGTTQIADGFQSNPYRRVRIGNQGRGPQEHVPGLRQRYAVFGRTNYALPALRASVSLMGRVYRDTWDVRAATAEAGVSGYLGQSILVSVRGRYHVQGGAIFYRTGEDYVTLGPVGQYWTGDRELAPMQTLLAGGKLAYLKRPAPQKNSWIEEMEINVKFDVLKYRLPAGAPNSDRSGAFIAQAGLMLRL